MPVRWVNHIEECRAYTHEIDVANMALVVIGCGRAVLAARGDRPVFTDTADHAVCVVDGSVLVQELATLSCVVASASNLWAVGASVGTA